MGILVLAVAVGYVVAVVDVSAIRVAAAGLAAEPLALAAALAVYASAFVLRALAWRRVLPGLTTAASWSALHVALLGNHVLPFRLGEALRVTSVLRRTSLPAKPVIASAVTLRLGDVVAVVALALLAAPTLVDALVGRGWTAIIGGGLLAATAAGFVWVRRLGLGGAAVRLPGPGVAAAVVVAWLFEAAIVWTVAGAAGVSLSVLDAIGVTAVTMVAQAVAVTPAGVGSYEAAGTAALVVLGVDAGPALAVVLLTHALKTAYALVVGAVALFLPAPGYFGRFRLPRRLPPRPAAAPIDPDAPVVAFIPAHDEEATVGAVVAQLPKEVAGHRVEVIVVDDGST
ncbi:MAG: lysylphosphatidylglycerol synthase domain-containing protein, partial [Jiangellaceae bacterium]